MSKMSLTASFSAKQNLCHMVASTMCYRELLLKVSDKGDNCGKKESKDTDSNSWIHVLSGYQRGACTMFLLINVWYLCAFRFLECQALNCLYPQTFCVDVFLVRQCLPCVVLAKRRQKEPL